MATWAGCGTTPGHPSRRPRGLKGGTQEAAPPTPPSRRFRQVRLGGGREKAVGPVGRGKAPGLHSRRRERVVWFMFETSFWPLRRDRNVGGREKAGRPSGLGRPSSAFAQAVPVCRKCPSPQQRLPRRAAGTQVHLPVTYGLCPWVPCLTGWSWGPPPPGSLPCVPSAQVDFPSWESLCPLNTGHTAVPHLYGQLALQKRSSLYGGTRPGLLLRPKVEPRARCPQAAPMSPSLWPAPSPPGPARCGHGPRTPLSVCGALALIVCSC